MKINDSLPTIVERALPALSGSSVTYNKQNNIYLTDGYTSAAGNTYYQGIRLSNRIIITYSIGEGYIHTFLNGINIYGYNGQDKKLIASRDFYCLYYSEYIGKYNSIYMLTNYLAGQARLTGSSIDTGILRDFATKLVEDALRNNPTKLLC